jgi:hypothetical protein
VIHGYLDRNEKGTLKFKLLLKYETGILTPQMAEIKVIIECITTTRKEKTKPDSIGIKKRLGHFVPANFFLSLLTLFPQEAV